MTTVTKNKTTREQGTKTRQDDSGKGATGHSDGEDDYSARSHDDDDDDDGDHNNNGTTREEAEAIAKRETRVVCGLRLIVLTVLMVSTVLLAIFVHSYLSGAEQDEFHEEFESDATKVLVSIGLGIDLSLGAVDAMAVSIVSHAKTTNQTWPFVTIPDFAVRAAKARRLAKASYVNMIHVVTPEQRADFEAYMPQHNQWLDEGIRIQENDENYYGPIIHDYYTVDYIQDTWELPMPQAEIYLPIWQVEPVIPIWSPYGYDALAWSDNSSYVAILDRHKVLISEPWLLPDPNNEEEMAEHNETVAWISDYVSPGQNPDEPITDIYYPLLDTMIDEVTVQDPSQENMVGFVTLSVYWRQMLENVLPSTARGVLVVVESCSPTFTFQLNGPTAIYLGRGDFHDPKYDDMEQSAFLFDLSDLSAGESFYSGIPIDQDYCPYTIRIFPSQLKEDDYTTSDPVVFAIIVAGVFLFTSFIFICYDQTVELRQRRVLSRANQSSAIVASLFPKAVRDRMYEEQKGRQREQAKKKRGGFNFSQAAAANNITAIPERAGAEKESQTNRKTRPIADHFEDTSICFADIVGFTKWSSTHSPEDVFYLLESIYSAFDSIAETRNVFKVETIGDSYVAVTGLPDVQKDHAVRMIRFARDCMFKISQVTYSLVDELGTDTQNLQMRIGIHSGPTTAGVLRGTKGRFQLFGDTVNTASRMESTGMPGRIQISQATADELIKRGKASWFAPRQDMVAVKGKGHMRTYWLAVDAARSATTRHSTNSGESSDRGVLDFSTGALEPLREIDVDDSDEGASVEDALELQGQLNGYLLKNGRGSPV